jgi:hypothetical protein
MSMAKSRIYARVWLHGNISTGMRAGREFAVSSVMLSARRRPTIRRVREWSARGTLPPPPRLVRDEARDEARTLPAIDAWSALDEEDIATLVPTNSEVRALFDDFEEGLDEQEETLLYARRAANDHVLPSDDDGNDEPSEVIALGDLLSLYERRTEELAEQRAHARAIAMQAETAPPAERERTRRRGQRRPSRREHFADFLGRHFYTIVFSLICVGGMLQLLLLP